MVIIMTITSARSEVVVVGRAVIRAEVVGCEGDVVLGAGHAGVEYVAPV